MPRDEDNGGPGPPHGLRTLLDYVWTGWRRREKPPLSFYLPLAILAVVLLGTQLYFVRDDPRRFAWVLVMLFLAFALMIFIAVLDCLHLWRKAVRDRERIFRETLGEKEFVRQVRAGIDRERKDS